MAMLCCNNEVIQNRAKKAFVLDSFLSLLTSSSTSNEHNHQFNTTVAITKSMGTERVGNCTAVLDTSSCIYAVSTSYVLYVKLHTLYCSINSSLECQLHVSSNSIFITQLLNWFQLYSTDLSLAYIIAKLLLVRITTAPQQLSFIENNGFKVISRIIQQHTGANTVSINNTPHTATIINGHISNTGFIYMNADDINGCEVVRSCLDLIVLVGESNIRLMESENKEIVVVEEQGAFCDRDGDLKASETKSDMNAKERIEGEVTEAVTDIKEGNICLTDDTIIPPSTDNSILIGEDVVKSAHDEVGILDVIMNTTEIPSCETVTLPPVLQLCLDVNIPKYFMIILKKYSSTSIEICISICKCVILLCTTVPRLSDNSYSPNHIALLIKLVNLELTSSLLSISQLYGSNGKNGYHKTLLQTSSMQAIQELERVKSMIFIAPSSATTTTDNNTKGKGNETEMEITEKNNISVILQQSETNKKSAVNTTTNNNGGTKKMFSSFFSNR